MSRLEEYHLWLLAIGSSIALLPYCRLQRRLMGDPVPNQPEPPLLGQKQKLVPKPPPKPSERKKTDAARLRLMKKPAYQLHCLTPIPRRGRAVHFHPLVGWTRLILIQQKRGPLPAFLKTLWKGKN